MYVPVSESMLKLAVTKTLKSVCISPVRPSREPVTVHVESSSQVKEVWSNVMVTLAGSVQKGNKYFNELMSRRMPH